MPQPRWPVLAVISAGGVLGSLARYGAQAAFPHTRDGFPWATFGINVVGSLSIGVLMVIVAEVGAGRPLLRPFVGVGVLGGFTTFSTYVVDIHQATRAGIALAYLAASVVGALTAVWAGAVGAGWAIRSRRR